MTKNLRAVLGTGALALAGLLAGCGNDDGGIGPGVNPPANVTAQALTSTSVEITFTPVVGATSYVVERAPGPSGGTFSQVGTSAASPFTDTGLEPNATYRYRVATVSGSTTSAFSSEAQATTLAPGRQVVNVTADITTNTTWVADNVYRLQGFRKVQPGATLTIQPGTRIEGDVNTVGSSLFVLRGARIQAVGTPANPIVFTSSQTVGTRQPGDWGGLIIIGNGQINRADPTNLEGTGTGADNPLINYAGGTDNTDNSGELRYVRVEFAGFGPAPDTELNSFTFAGVGSGTTLNYLESLAGLDDAFEWFGGAVDAKYLVSYESGDDHFDMSEGYSGRLQYLIALQSKILQPRPGAGNVSQDPQGIENDGCAGASCTNGQDSQPFTIPVVANFTLIGTPSGVTIPSGGGRGMVLRRGTGGLYVNGLVGRWPTAGLSVRDAATTGARQSAGLLDLDNLLVVETPALFDASNNVTVDAGSNAIDHQPAVTAASQLTALPTDPADAAALDWTPAGGSAAASGGLTTFSGELAARAGSAVTGTVYRGAADPSGSDKWWQGWTSYADN
ncbi:MAG TPA: fibronectin type III domain-containing protein [Gemmatimonadales bacterium]|nr:fibronectin type III domain-containing protein [Gemmatimonadales bacterium]